MASRDKPPDFKGSRFRACWQVNSSWVPSTAEDSLLRFGFDRREVYSVLPLDCKEACSLCPLQENVSFAGKSVRGYLPLHKSLQRSSFLTAGKFSHDYLCLQGFHALVFLQIV